MDAFLPMKSVPSVNPRAIENRIGRRKGISNHSGIRVLSVAKLASRQAERADQSFVRVARHLENGLDSVVAKDCSHKRGSGKCHVWKTQLAKGEVGIRDSAPVPTIAEFAEHDFAPFIETRFENKPNTLAYYRNGVRSLKAYPAIADCKLDVITADKIGGFVAKLRESGLSVASINRQLEVLRRILKLSLEWGRVDRALPRVEMLPGENHRDRVLSHEEETRYLGAATTIGNGMEEAYQRALNGVRATLRGEEPKRRGDPFILRDATTLIVDCGLRPDECFRLWWEHIRNEALDVPFGKTENARRTIPLTPRAAAYLEMRRAVAKKEWVFPAATKAVTSRNPALRRHTPKPASSRILETS
jgi:integrase